MTFPMLSKGQNMSLPDEVQQVDVVLGWTESEIEVDASALLLDADGKVRSDADFVFYNQPESSDESTRLLGTSTTEEGAQARITIDLSAVSPDVHTVALAGSLDTGSFGDLGKLTFRVMDGAGQTLAEYVTADATTESAFVFGQVYRRGDQWKVRVVGQGWDGGLSELAGTHGVGIDDGVESVPAATPLEAPATAAPAVDTPKPKSRGVRTAKKIVRKAKPARPTMAENENWQPARLFSVIGVGTGDEQERRTTSTLISTMQSVPKLARVLCNRMGSPTGPFEGFLEVQYELGDTKVIPDAVLKVAGRGRQWTALLEVKTGSGKLTKVQLENYLDVAKKKKYDAVISLSNHIPATAGELPVEVSRSKVAKADLRHLSWADVTHEVRMLVSHGEIENETQAWILSEFLRYLEHDRSGATQVVDMGKNWVAVRNSVIDGTLRAGDPEALAVSNSWVSLSRHLALRLTAELGVTVKHYLPTRLRNDASARNAAFAERLAADGTFEAVLKIPETAGDLIVVADVRTSKIRCRTTIDAPNEGTSNRRVSWLLKQLKDAPGGVQVEAVFSERGNEACELLEKVRENSKLLSEGRVGDIVSFGLEQSSTMGSRRSDTAQSFVKSVTDATDVFYGGVVQQLREWVPAAPQQSDQPRPSAADEDEPSDLD